MFRISPIVIGSFILLILFIGYKIKKARNNYEDEEEEERLIPSHNGLSLKKTPTYYQWNRTPPSCQSSPISPEKSWEQRRSVLLKKYSAIE